MLVEFQCDRCRWVKTESLADDLIHPGVCMSCIKTLPPGPPPMRKPHSSLAPSVGSLLIVLVFIAGIAVGAKMAGGW